MKKFAEKTHNGIISSGKWCKFSIVNVGRGKTAFPSTSSEQERIGVRWDFDGEVTKSDGITYNKFQMQPNAGSKIPAIIKQWREKNGGTHAVMANVFIKKGGSKEDVEAGLKAAIDQLMS